MDTPSPTPDTSDLSQIDTGTPMHRRLRALAVLALGALIAFFVYTNVTDPEAQFPFRLGLDLAGGSQLIYEADVSDVPESEVAELMDTLRERIDQRLNAIGTEENAVYVEQSSFVSDEVRHRLVVELPGVTDVSEADEEIVRAPLLEFKLIDQEIAQREGTDISVDLEGEGTDDVTEVELDENGTSTDAEAEEEVSPYIDTGLTGRFLDSAQLDFNGGQESGTAGREPIVLLNFNREGAELFEEITANNIGEQLAIFLDGELRSAPRINERIPGGTAVISGGFTPEEARELARNLNLGALPVPVELVSTQTIGATLGAEVLDDGIGAGIIGFALVCAFMLMWYRMPGIVAAVALSIYVTAMLALFMLIPVTLTAAGLAGFVLSLGMAVDANVLVFERMKELYRTGQASRISAYEGFTRAWSAIRDGNVTSLLSAVILFWFGTSLVQGFALVFGIGILVSMVTAVTVTRSLLLVLPNTDADSSVWQRRLFHSGLKK